MEFPNQGNHPVGWFLVRVPSLSPSPHLTRTDRKRLAPSSLAPLANPGSRLAGVAGGGPGVETVAAVGAVVAALLLARGERASNDRQQGSLHEKHLNIALQMVVSTFIWVLKKQHASNGCNMHLLRSPVHVFGILPKPEIRNHPKDPRPMAFARSTPSESHKLGREDPN